MNITVIFGNSFQVFGFIFIHFIFKTLAYKSTRQEDFDRGSLFPTLDRVRESSLEIAVEVAKYAFEHSK